MLPQWHFVFFLCIIPRMIGENTSKMAYVYLTARGVKIVGYVNLPFLLSFSGLRSNLSKTIIKQFFFASVSLYPISLRSDRVDIGFSLSELPWLRCYDKRRFLALVISARQRNNMFPVGFGRGLDSIYGRLPRQLRLIYIFGETSNVLFITAYAFFKLEGRKISGSQFLKVLSTLRVWEICAPDINAAIEVTKS